MRKQPDIKSRCKICHKVIYGFKNTFCEECLKKTLKERLKALRKFDKRFKKRYVNWRKKENAGRNK